MSGTRLAHRPPRAAPLVVPWWARARVLLPHPLVLLRVQLPAVGTSRPTPLRPAAAAMLLLPWLVLLLLRVVPLLLLFGRRPLLLLLALLLRRLHPELPATLQRSRSAACGLDRQVRGRTLHVRTGANELDSAGGHLVRELERRRRRGLGYLRAAEGERPAVCARPSQASVSRAGIWRAL